MVALAKTGGTTAGTAAIEDKKAEASDRATEAAGGRTAAAVVTLPVWAIATDASDKATEACSIADSCGLAVHDAGIEVTVTVTVMVSVLRLAWIEGWKLEAGSLSRAARSNLRARRAL